MRLFFVLLLCLTLPLQGWGGGVRQQTPCPMEAAMAMQADSADVALELAMDDCCNDAETFKQTGQLCKNGQECQAPAGFLAPPVLPVAQPLPVSDLQVTVSTDPPQSSPANIWRPPSLL